MTRNWLILFGFLTTWYLSSSIPTIHLGRSSESDRGISVVLYDEPDIGSTSSPYLFSTRELPVDYEYCNFYQVVVSSFLGQPNYKYLYKNAHEIKELDLKVKRLDGFEKRNCNQSAQTPSNNNTNRTYRNPLETGVPMKGLELFDKPVPPPSVQRKLEQLEQERYRKIIEANKNHNH